MDFSSIPVEYEQTLKANGVAERSYCFYRRWVRLYLELCLKQGWEPQATQNIAPYLQAHQPYLYTPFLKQQAEQAIQLYITMHNQAQRPTITAINEMAASCFPCDNIPDWIELYAQLEQAIKVRHYSPKTLKSYTSWCKQFEIFTKRKPTAQLTPNDLKAFLSHLAITRKVSAPSQNQAFHALRFLFQQVLNQDFGKIKGVVRAKHKPYIPVVLSRGEINQILERLEHPYRLIAQLLYGCGLRLSECLNLRVQDLNIDMGILTIHDGKGQKDRTLPLPQTLIPALQQQLQVVAQNHQRDLKQAYDGVFLKHQLAAKFKNAPKAFVWQWLFPAIKLTYVPDKNQYLRYHLHETHVQRAIHQAVQQSAIPKRASAHTLRHSFATHLLQANYDICTIQTLMGHSDIRTTMIYLQTVKSQTIKEAISPLDFELNGVQAKAVGYTGTNRI